MTIVVTPPEGRSEVGPEVGNWPLKRSVILNWLVKDTSGQRYLDNILVDFCDKLRQSGMPVARVSLHLQILHPQWLGARILWRPGFAEAEIQTFGHSIVDDPGFLASPMAAIHNGSGMVRRRLDQADGVNDFPICAELAGEGMTDYIAWPLDFTLGKRHVITFSSDRPGGFTDEEVAWIADFLPVLALVCEIRSKNRLVRTLLDTYVGPHASEQILAGSITRGSGVTVNAVILVCDLRGFTSISELWPRDDVITLLNEYFDAMSEPVERHGGEILKFIGDGMLAIFPLVNPRACFDALKATGEARDAMAVLNEGRVGRGLVPLGYGIGVHLGDVMYGNIGSRARLDFTVIGPAVNVAARIEGLTKKVGRKVLFSSAFVAELEAEHGLDPLGPFPLRGVGEPIDVFAFAEPPLADTREPA